MTGLIILIAVVVVFVTAFLARKKGIAKLKEQGLNFKDAKQAGTLIGGHPSIDKPIKGCYIVPDNNRFVICTVSYVPKGDIKKDLIKNIVFEDATSFERRVTAGRMLLVGVFALAWKKRSKNENAYVIVEWNDGRFDHSTSFLFEGTGSIQKANAFRNWMIKNATQELL